MRRILAFDLNGVLCATSYRRSDFRDDAAVGRVGKKFVCVRPGARETLTRLLDAGHAVGVWSSCPLVNTAPTARYVLGDELYARLAFVWGRERCAMSAVGYGTTKLRATLVRVLGVPIDSAIALYDDSSDKVSPTDLEQWPDYWHDVVPFTPVSDAAHDRWLLELRV